MHEHIYGIVPPMTTPFQSDDTMIKHCNTLANRTGLPVIINSVDGVIGVQ